MKSPARKMAVLFLPALGLFCLIGQTGCAPSGPVRVTDMAQIGGAITAAEVRTVAVRDHVARAQAAAERLPAGPEATVIKTELGAARGQITAVQDQLAAAQAARAAAVKDNAAQVAGANAAITKQAKEITHLQKAGRAWPGLALLNLFLGALAFFAARFIRLIPQLAPFTLLVPDFVLGFFAVALCGGAEVLLFQFWRSFGWLLHCFGFG